MTTTIRKIGPTGVSYDDTSAAELAIVDRDLFAGFFALARMESALIGQNCAAYDVDRDETDTIFRLALDGRSGYAVRSDGELVYVWSLERGRGDAMVDRAVKRDGAVYLDCFEGHLVDLYSRHGFEVVATVPNWNAGGPAVAYMAQSGHAHRHGI